MTQKLIGDILYVFQTTPYQITQDASEATTIKVQEECYNGFVELNPDLTEKFARYNYHTMTVTQQEWAPYVDEPDPVGENYTFTLYPGAQRAMVGVAFSDGQNYPVTVDDSHMPGMNDPINIEGYGQYEGYVYTYEVPENIEITLSPNRLLDYYTYDTEEFSYDYETNSLTPSIVMDADKAVYFVYAAYSFTISGQDLAYKTTNYVDGVDINNWYATNLHKGQQVKIVPTDDPSYYTLVSGDVSWDSEQGAWIGTIGAGNLEVVINYAQPASGYTVTLEGSSIHTHVTVKMNNETVSTEFQYSNVADNTVVDIYPTEDASHYSLQSGATWDTDHWTATVNGSDLTIEINYIG